MILSWRIKGQPITLFYSNGFLLRAIYRDDDGWGYDVTHNAARLKGVPHEIKYKGRLEVAGVATIKLEAYEKIGRKPKKASPQSLCRRCMRALHSADVAKYGLEFLAYQMRGLFKAGSAETEYRRLGQFGFPVVPRCTLSANISASKVNWLLRHKGPRCCAYPSSGLLFEHEVNSYDDDRDLWSKEEHAMALLWPNPYLKQAPLKQSG